jgi:hypothetical protein
MLEPTPNCQYIISRFLLILADFFGLAVQYGCYYNISETVIELLKSLADEGSRGTWMLGWRQQRIVLSWKVVSDLHLIIPIVLTHLSCYFSGF